MSKKPDNRTDRAAQLLAEQKRAERLRKLAIIGSIVAVLVVIVGVAFLVQSGRDTTGETTSVSSTPAKVTADFGVLVGEDSAATKLTIYEDLQCPICAQFEAATGAEIEQGIESGDVQVEYRMVSFLDRASDNDYSSRAMNAAIAVQETAGSEAFKQFHDELFAAQPEEGTAGPEDDELVDRAVEAGAEESAVRALIEEKTYEQWIKNATDGMSKNDVTGTPTIFIDGERQEGSIQEAVDAVLAAVG